MKLYVNGQIIDTYVNSVIAQTKQINDINSLDTRNANYTLDFKVPKTANNVRVFQFLTVPGNTSPLPYQKNSCSLFGDSGECFILNGRAMVADEGENYSVYILDGLINLYKKIENQTLFDLGLSEITHTKDTPTIVASWTSFDTYYKYILADYNGITGNTGSGSVNSDWLVPSVSVAYLWAKIFSANGFTYSGNVFLTQAFKNLWMTYPKGVNSIASEETIFHSDQWANRQVSNHYTFIKLLNDDVNTLAEFSSDKVFMKPGVTGQYRLTVHGNINMPFNVDYSRMFVVKNGQNSSAYPLVGTVADLYEVFNFPADYEGAFEFSEIINLQSTDTLALAYKLPQNGETNIAFDSLTLDVTLTKVNATSIDFGDAFKDFNVKDFMTEIVHRFGLTIYTDKSNPYHYQFLTLQEILQNSNYNDWSDKFSHKVKENYIYGSYAQRNYFRYKYNDEQASHNDGFIPVPNENLADTKDAIKSKIYSPEREQVTYMNRLTNVYKLWSKEPNTGDDAATNPYKFNALDKRYYFLRAEPKTGAFDIYSEETAQLTTHSGTYYIENYYRLPFDEIRQDYYIPLSQILEDARIIEAKLWLTEADVANIDFRKLIYIEQEANYFLLNKIVDYIPGRLATVELVRVKYAAQPLDAPVLILTLNSLGGAGSTITASFTISYTVPTLVVQTSSDYGITWINNSGAPTSPRTLSGMATGVYLVRLFDPINNITSNTLSVLVTP